MSRTALTTQDHIYSIEYFAMNNPAFEKTHYDVIQLIEQKKLGELIDKEKYLLKKTYQYINRRIKYNETLTLILEKDDHHITKIERDILDYSYIKEVVPPVLKHYFLAEKMLDNYMSKLPDNIKIKIHQNILDTDDALEKQKNTKKRNRENHKKFFIGGTLLSLLKLNNIDDDPLEILFEIMKLHLIHDYFDRKSFNTEEINEFNISETGREFNNKKNSILLKLNNPFIIYDE